MKRSALILVVLGLAMVARLSAQGPSDEVLLMDPDLYEAILFPGYEDWNAVWDLHVSGPYIYVALCAEEPWRASARLFRYDPRTGEKKMILDPDRVAGIDLSSGRMPQSKFHTAIRTMKDGRLVMVSHNTAAGRFQPDWRLDSLWHDPTGFSSQMFVYDPARDVATYLGTPVSGEDIYYGQLDRDREIYYGSGMRSGGLYAIHLEDGRAEEIADHPSYIAIVVDDDHCVYTSDDKHRIWRWDPDRNRSEMTALRMPHSPHLTESVGSWVYGWKDPDGWIYAVAQFGNRFCRFKPREEIMEDLGCGWREDPQHPGAEMIFAPVRARNGRIYYGVLNEAAPFRDGAEVIELDPETRRKRNLGTMKLPDGTNANVFGEGGLGPDGRIYWGDGNHGVRGGMMWAFDPGRVPEDYVPTAKAKRVPRVLNLPPDRDVTPWPRTGKLFRFVPQVRRFGKDPAISDNSLRGAAVTTRGLKEGGLPLWENAVLALSRPLRGFVYGLAGGPPYKLIRFDERSLALEVLATLPDRDLPGGGRLAAHGEDIWIAAEKVYRFSEKSGIVLFNDPGTGQRAAALVADAGAGVVYVLVEPANRIDVLGIGDGGVRRSIPLEGHVVSRWLAPAPGGGAFIFGSNARIWRCGDAPEPILLSGTVPSFRGQELIAEVTSAAADDVGRIWAGTREGYLFSIDPDTAAVVNHGKPGTSYLMGVAPQEGIVYAFGGGDFGDTHLHRFTAAAGFVDMGRVSRRLVSAAVAGSAGALLAGEFSSASSLLRIVPERLR